MYEFRCDPEAFLETLKMAVDEINQEIALRSDLEAYVANRLRDEGENRMWLGPYFLDKAHPFRDFCREIVEPGTNVDYPEGAVGIRGDDDFWPVAALPYPYKGLSIQALVEVLWPAYAADPGVVYLPDSGSLPQGSAAEEGDI